MPKYGFILCNLQSAVFAKSRDGFTKSRNVFTKVVIVFEVDKIAPLYYLIY